MVNDGLAYGNRNGDRGGSGVFAAGIIIFESKIFSQWKTVSVSDPVLPLFIGSGGIYGASFRKLSPV